MVVMSETGTDTNATAFPVVTDGPFQSRPFIVDQQSTTDTTTETRLLLLLVLLLLLLLRLHRSRDAR
jgi:hypothetical protein